MIDKFNLNKDITFLNHGSFGACTKKVMNEYIQYQYQLENQPVDFIEKKVPKLLALSRSKLADFLNTSSDDIVLLDNPTTAINEVIRSLQLDRGDEIITTDHEYGAMDKAWEFITEKKGANYKRVELPFPIESSKDIFSTIVNSISQKTKILFISHITSPTGIIFPVEDLCKYARENNIITIIDGAHVPGHIQLDIKDLNPDFYIGTCHKWLCTPKGVSFLYVRRNFQDSIDPLIIGWGWRDFDSNLSEFINNHEWWGTRDMSAYFCLPSALKMHQTKEMIDGRMHCQSKIPIIRNIVNDITSQMEICPNNMLGQMASMVMPNIDHVNLKTTLINEYKIEIPVFKWKNMSILRVSYQVYNTEKDIEKLSTVLTKIFK
tara:strand:+ start:371 stop:1501 length:1131 start_codon:yes stop_codon:yes gene_type:complete